MVEHAAERLDNAQGDEAVKAHREVGRGEGQVANV
jgi:hypothetical protein